ncbi:Ribonuclease III [Trema orientale]|uniref:Ribonuclease III n=1 Tax=Trema orientale TaxID=63057 RepID=A0A2P5EG49_TREOI|nr:Ribonuclease III [Trema orientale]
MEIEAKEVGEKLREEGEKETEFDLNELEEVLGYNFKNRSLLEKAFTHASFAPGNCDSYDRLEYVGDAVLNLLFSNEHYFLYPELSSGQLTRLRASNVDTEKLARVALNHGLHKYLRHNKPLFKDQIRKFTLDISDYPLHSNGLIDVPKVLADIVESAIGAVFIDSNSSLDTVWTVFKGLLEPLISPETMKRHPVTELYEMCQKNNLKVKFVDLWAKNTAFDVFIEGQLVGTASYGLKKEVAHNRAAKNALDNIGKILSEKESS